MAMDGPGIVLIIAAVCCLLLALHWGGNSLSWGSTRVIGLFVGFGLLTIAFGLVQWRMGDKATVPLRLLRQSSIFMGACYLFFLEMAIYVVSTMGINLILKLTLRQDLYYLPFYFQSAQGVSATTSGVRAIPLGLSQIFAVIIVGAIVTRTGYYVGSSSTRLP